jgi:hypothetical protein
MLWLEPIFDEKCNVTVNLLDLDLDLLSKINEFRRIRNSVELLHHEQAKEEIEKAQQASKLHR